MKKIFSKSIVAAVLALPALSFAAVTPVAFDWNGAAAGGQVQVDVFDWAPGNALAIGGNPGTGPIAAGAETQLLYQANLGVASLNGVSQFAGNAFGFPGFTAVAGFKEVVLSNPTGFNPVFGFADAPVLSGTNFFYIYANQVGNNLTGLGFVGSTLIMSGHITEVLSSSYSTTGQTSTKLDNFGADNYAGTGTLIGSGTTDIRIQIDSADANYFPGLDLDNFVFGFFNASQVTPFNQADPSAQFSIDGLTNGGTASNIGLLNGVTNPGVNRNFQFQADGNSSFEIPEPDSLALFGLALGFLGFIGRRNGKKA